MALIPVVPLRGGDAIDGPAASLAQIRDTMVPRRLAVAHRLTRATVVLAAIAAGVCLRARRRCVGSGATVRGYGLAGFVLVPGRD
jgi:hypothetical protein